MASTSTTPARPRWQRAVYAFFGSIASFSGALLATVALFCVLPIINRIAGGERQFNVIEMPDEFVEEPEEVIEEPEEEEPEEEEPEEEPPPPELQEEIQEISLEQLEAALSGGAGSGAGPTEFTVKGLSAMAGAEINSLEMNDLGGKPRPRSDPQIELTARERKVTPGRATVRFVVDENGRVQNAKVHEATHPLLGKAALKAIKKVRYYPAKRDGKPVRKAVSFTIDFPKQ